MTSFRATFKTDTVHWGFAGGRKRGKKQAEEAAKTNRRRTKKRLAAERTARREKYGHWKRAKERERGSNLGSFRFSSALEFFLAVHNTPFLKYSFRRVMLQLEVRQSRCKREGSHVEQSWSHPGGTHAVCMQVGNLIYRHLPFKKLGFYAVQLGPLLFLKYFFSDEQCSNFSLDDPNPINRTVRNGDKKTDFCSSKTLKSLCRWLVDRHQMPVSNPDNNCANGLSDGLCRCQRRSDEHSRYFWHCGKVSWSDSWPDSRCDWQKIARRRWGGVQVLWKPTRGGVEAA